MNLRIGKFNNIPLYLDIPTPFQLIKRKRLLEKDYILLAYADYEPFPYDHQKAKHEGKISINFISVNNCL